MQVTCIRLSFIRALTRERSVESSQLMELIEDYDGVAKRSPSLRPLSAVSKHGIPAEIERSSNKSFKKRCPDEDSWTSVDRQELDHAVGKCLLIWPI